MNHKRFNIFYLRQLFSKNIEGWNFTLFEKEVKIEYKPWAYIRDFTVYVIWFAYRFERSQKSVTLDFLKIDKKTDRVDFERGYLLTNSWWLHEILRNYANIYSKYVVRFWKKFRSK